MARVCSAHTPTYKEALETPYLVRFPVGRAVRRQRCRATEDHHQLSEPERGQLAAVPGQGRRVLPKVRARRHPDFWGYAGWNRDAGERRGAGGKLFTRTAYAGSFERRIAGAD